MSIRWVHSTSTYGTFPISSSSPVQKVWKLDEHCFCCQSISPTRKKTVQVIVFDVSGSIRPPLKLCWTHKTLIKGQANLIPSECTAFDVICRLAKDGVGAAKDQAVCPIVCGIFYHYSIYNTIPFNTIPWPVKYSILKINTYCLIL